MKRLIPLVVLVAATLLLFPVHAQDSQTIEYGQSVIVELSRQDDEIPFRFTGKANEVIVAHMILTDRRTLFSDGILRLANSDGEILGDTTDPFAGTDATLVFELPEDGEYTLVVTRRESRISREYKVYLGLPVELTGSQSISAEISSGTHNDYYLIRQTGNPSTLTYRVLGGDAWPGVKIARMRDAQLGGLIGLNVATITEIQVALPLDVDPIIIEVGGGWLVQGTSGRTTSYELEIS